MGSIRNLVVWSSVAAVLQANTAIGSWKELWKHADPSPNKYPIRAYSEFMPAPVWGVRPYERRVGDTENVLRQHPIREYFDPNRDEEFLISEDDEFHQIRPALAYVAKHWLHKVNRLIDGKEVAGVSETLLKQSGRWEEGDPARAKGPVLSFTSITLSRSQDYQGRFRWTIYGGSALGSERIFWESLTEKEKVREGTAVVWLQEQIRSVYGGEAPPGKALEFLRKRGLRILSSLAYPSSLASLKIEQSKDVKMLLTFEPFSKWPKSLQAEYRANSFPVIPHPATLVFEGAPLYEKLAQSDAEGRELPLAEAFTSFSGYDPVRILPVRSLSSNAAKQFYRFGVSKPTKAGNLAVRESDGAEDALVPALDAAKAFESIFSGKPELLQLYGKPIARNVQIWGILGPKAGEWLLHGDSADAKKILGASVAIGADLGRSNFHYREYYPPMDIDGFQIRWHRPLVAWRDTDGKAKVNYDNLGVVYASKRDAARKKGLATVLFRPMLHDTFGVSDSMRTLDSGLADDVRRLLRFEQHFGQSFSARTATVLLAPEKTGPVEWAEWLKKLSKSSPKVAARIVKRFEKTVVPAPISTIQPQTFSTTVGKGAMESTYEGDYWQKLVALTKKDFQNKNNVDCAEREKRTPTDKPTDDDQALLKRYRECRANDLPDMAETYLAKHYLELGYEVFVHAFKWETDFEFSWWGGLKLNPIDGDADTIARLGHKNLIVRIPGDKSTEAVVMGDHYDTAYMQDMYDSNLEQLAGHRQASEGADDNASATAALMQAAEAFHQAKWKPKRDVWLVHLTGEEFPADCLGARALSQSLVENRAVLTGQYRLNRGRVAYEKVAPRANPRIVGLYVLDMVAHDTGRDEESRERGFAERTFQISPGRGKASADLAMLAHRVTETWNANVPGWNAEHRRDREPTRSTTIDRPPSAKYPTLRGEIRLGWDPRSSLFNTDGQIFSDAGIPVVLFMENYDISRTGYHDTHDTLANIDLDYGAALTRIAIEAVAQRAME